MPVPFAARVTTPGRSSHQALEVAAIQGQGIDFVVAYRSAQRRVGRIDGGHLAAYGDGLRLFARLDHQIDANILRDLHQHAAVFRIPESFGRRAHRIRAGSQIVGQVLSGIVSGQGSRGPSGHIGDRDGCAGDGAPGLIQNRAPDGSGNVLSKRGQAKHQRHGCSCQRTDCFFCQASKPHPTRRTETPHRDTSRS